MKHELAIIIVNYTNYWDTLGIIKQLRGQKQITCQYLIVDNNSPNESVEKLKINLPNEAILIINTDNVGYAKAINQGLRYAIQKKIKHSLIVNNDIKITHNLFLRNMVDFLLKNQNLAAISPLIQSPKGGLTTIFYQKPSLFDIFCGGFISLIKHWLIGKRLINNGGLLPVYRIYGSCMMVGNQLIKEAGYFDENTFLYSEEEILAERFSANNMLSGINCDEYVIHHHSMSVDITFLLLKRIRIKMISKERYLREYRNIKGLLLKTILLGFSISTYFRLLTKNMIKY